MYLNSHVISNANENICICIPVSDEQSRLLKIQLLNMAQLHLDAKIVYMEDMFSSNFNYIKPRFLRFGLIISKRFVTKIVFIPL